MRHGIKDSSFQKLFVNKKNYNLPIDVRSVMEGIFAINV